MNIFLSRPVRRAGAACAALLIFFTSPALVITGCSSASSGHAPGVAGGETLVAVTTNFPMAYVKRPFPMKDIDVRDLITSTTGGDLYVRSQASAGGIEANVTAGITMGMGDVRDPDVSPDGTKVVFSLRLPLDPNLSNDDPKQPNWHVYIYDAVAKAVTQLTNDDITAGHDIGPHYLPDGRIVFASTRQTATQKILLDEGRPQYPAQTDNRQSPIFLLHVMNADGSTIHQITFNTNHDFAPSVLNNGQVVFSRWEASNGGDAINLYRVNPDGTGLELYYGAMSHASGANIAGTNTNVVQFLNARQRPDGKLLAIDRPFTETQLGGDALLIDADNYVEIHQPVLANAGATAPAQASATLLGVTTDAKLPSLGGHFASAYPLYDGTNRMVVSWSPCFVLDTTMTPAATNVCNASNTSGPNVMLAPPEYTLWVYDFDKSTLDPVLAAQPGIMTLDAVIMQPRTPAPIFVPDFVPTTTTQQNLATAQVGLLNIASVYDFDGVDKAVPSITATADPSQASYYARPYRFIRIVKAVEIPDKKVRKINNSAFGPAGMGMREILGYAPIQPDGSVQVQVPSDVPFTIDILDANARRITARHESWLQLMPGEIKTCNGCHAGTATSAHPSHGRSGLTTAAYTGAPTAGTPFPNANPAVLSSAAGDTMAAALAVATCGTTAKSQGAATCAQVLGTDVIYTPTWTSGVTIPAGSTDPIISYPYGVDSTGSGAVGLSEPPPLAGNCQPWSAQCRVTIHYANASTATPVFLQNVWNLPRQTLAADGVTVLTDHTCVLCHNPLTSASAGTPSMVQVPLGQLDLTGTASSLDQTVVTSYEQLLFPHNEQTLNMGVLQDLLVPGPPGPPDPVTGQPTTTMVPMPLAGAMMAGSAGGSASFFGEFSASGTHFGYLTPAELRLISEWLDIGGQFYNDPFVAPAAN
jgi:Tol biopolymer transport system component